jgi:Vault protein inter-alpha-trypsin domain/von Willebrand factor type A domain
MRTLAKWIVLGMVLAAEGCGARGKTGVGGEAVARTPSAPLNAAVAVVSGDGIVEARLQDSAKWAVLEKGRRVANVVALRVQGGGAVLDVGDGRGRLWLKDDTSIELGQDEAGEVRVVVAQGEARLRHGVRDVLFFPRAGKTEQMDTRKNVGEADFSLRLETGPDAAGIGQMEARGPAGQIAPVSLARVTVKVKQAGDYAETEVEHVFANDSDQQLEGTFRFPMPEGAMLTGLAMEINEKLMEGELVERDKAQKIYQEIVDQMQDPALLEWEHGNVFKLRVFPIEAKKSKRVVLRFVSPLSRTLDGWQYVYPTSSVDPASQKAAFKLEFEGKTIVDRPDLSASRDVIVPLVGGRVPTVVREKRDDGVYTAVRVQPDWSKVPEPKGPRPARRFVVVVDTSRSALEERDLEVDALKMVLAEMGPDDRYVAMTSDVVARPESGELVAPTAEAIDKTVAFVKRLEPDGASDVGAALRQAGRLAKASREKDGKDVEILYIGDGSPTWGETNSEALAKIAKDSLGASPLHAMVLGKAGDVDGVHELAAASGGQLDRPRTALDAKRFALRLAQRPLMRRITAAHVVARDADVVFPSREETIVEGDDIAVLVKTPKGTEPPAQITLKGIVDGKDVSQVVALGKADGAAHVGQRWARSEILRLEQDGAEQKDAVVKTSLAFGIMSQYTSFLVLESEEAYAKYDIARKAAKREAEAAQARVTGGDLENVNGRNARLEPDHLQPGDPEIQVPAPADAESVVVVFPFGESKVASYEAGSVNAWTVRFLIDKDTPDGTYQVKVRITHKGGALEVLELPYVVDTKKPTVNVSLHPVPGKPGTYEIRASQTITLAEIQAANPGVLGQVGELRKRYASILTDAYRVEVRLPDGTTMPLTAIRLGEFRGIWKPDAPLGGPVTLHVVAVDRAMNQSESDVSLSATPAAK